MMAVPDSGHVVTIEAPESVQIPRIAPFAGLVIPFE